MSRRSGALVLGNEILSAMPAGIPPAQTARAEAVQRQIHETNMRRLTERYYEWSARTSVNTDAQASMSTLLSLPIILVITRNVGGFANVVAIITCLTLALVSHLYIIRSHGQQYIAYREQIVCSVRVLAVMSCVMMWASSGWDLSRQQLVCSRLLFGAFCSLGWQLRAYFSFVLQTLLLILIRFLMYTVKRRDPDVRCSPLAICELTDPSRLPSGVPTHFTLADHDTKQPDTLGFSYSHRGFFFDLTFIVLIPWVLVRIKQRHSRSMFQDEENRRDDRRSGTESRRRGRRGQDDVAGGRVWSDTTQSRVWHLTRRFAPLMEFRDEELERRFDWWHRNVMTRVDLLRAMVSMFTGLMWSRRLSVFFGLSSWVIGASYIFTQLVQFLFITHNHSFYVRHRSVFVLTQKMLICVVEWILTLLFAMSNRNILLEYYRVRPELAPRGVVEALQAWNQTQPIGMKDYTDIASVAAKSGQPPPVNTLPTKLVLAAYAFQCLGSHVTLRLHMAFLSFLWVGDRLFRLIESGIPMEEVLFGYGASFSSSIDSPDQIRTRGTISIGNIFATVAMTIVVELGMRRVFIKGVNFATRQREFMQSRLLRLTGMTMDVPPRPLSQAEEERLAEALRYGRDDRGDDRDAPAVDNAGAATGRDGAGTFVESLAGSGGRTRRRRSQRG